MVVRQRQGSHVRAPAAGSVSGATRCCPLPWPISGYDKPSCTVCATCPWPSAVRSPLRVAARRHLARCSSCSLAPAAMAPAVRPPPTPGWEAQAGPRCRRCAARDETLAATLPGTAKLGYHPETGRVRFISGTPSQAASRAPERGRRGQPTPDRCGCPRQGPQVRRQLRRALRPWRSRRPSCACVAPLAPWPRPPVAPEDAGAGLPNATVRFDQVRDGVPVMGGEIVVQLTEDGEVLSAAGEVLPSALEGHHVRHGRREAGPHRGCPLGWRASSSARSAAVTTASEGLGLYDPRMMDDPRPGRRRHPPGLAGRCAGPATGRQQADRRLVIVDARSGQVLTTHRPHLRRRGPDRRVCDNRNRPGAVVGLQRSLRPRGGPVSWTGHRDVDAAYRLMGVAYDFFKSRFGRDGIDGKGARMKATVRYCPSYGCPWRNAEWRWGPQQATFGRGWAKADDIVAHEYTHGVLDAEAPLFYHYQSGAINESIADVFGELVDLSYPGGKDNRWSAGRSARTRPSATSATCATPPARATPIGCAAPSGIPAPATTAASTATTAWATRRPISWLPAATSAATGSRPSARTGPHVSGTRR